MFSGGIEKETNGILQIGRIEIIENNISKLINWVNWIKTEISSLMNAPILNTTSNSRESCKNYSGFKSKKPS